LIPFLVGAITDLTLQVRSLRGELNKSRRPEKQGA
jgi:hypothetical protein